MPFNQGHHLNAKAVRYLSILRVKTVVNPQSYSRIDVYLRAVDRPHPT